MKRILFVLALVAMALWVKPVEAYRAVTACPSTSAIWTAGAINVDPVVDVNGNLCNIVTESLQYPQGATPVTASAVGTTGATAATLPGVAAKTTYLCGFSVRANATAAVTGNITVAGVITGTLNYTHWTAPLASGIGITEPPIGTSCIPASAVNTGIVVTGPAPGAGGTISTSAWGYQK